MPEKDELKIMDPLAEEETTNRFETINLGIPENKMGRYLIAAGIGILIFCFLYYILGWTVF